MCVLHPGSPDPETLTAGMMVTCVGELSGSSIEKMDEVDYRYPTLTVTHWYIWSPATLDDLRGGPYFGVFGGMGIGGFGIGY